MKTQNVVNLLSVVLIIFFTATVASAGDFDWTRDLNIKAEVDPSGFRAQLSTRFKIGDAQVKVVLGKVDRPADAYMVFRLGELSSRSADYVLNKYKTEKSNGWGALAKSLGIKPGSREFHALKQGSDIDTSENRNNKHKKSKHNGKG